jgi:hypothetical protein
VLAIFTIFHIGVFTENVSEINFLKKKISQISKENQRLEDEILNMNLPHNLSQFVKNSSLIKAEKIKFIQILEGGVVAK